MNTHLFTFLHTIESNTNMPCCDHHGMFIEGGGYQSDAFYKICIPPMHISNCVVFEHEWKNWRKHESLHHKTVIDCEIQHEQSRKQCLIGLELQQDIRKRKKQQKQQEQEGQEGQQEQQEQKRRKIIHQHQPRQLCVYDSRLDPWEP